MKVNVIKPNDPCEIRWVSSENGKDIAHMSFTTLSSALSFLKDMYPTKSHSSLKERLFVEESSNGLLFSVDKKNKGYIVPVKENKNGDV